LCGLNSMEAGCTQIYAGVRLLIRWKGPTPSPAPTLDEPPATVEALDNDRLFSASPTNDSARAALAAAAQTSPTASLPASQALSAASELPSGDTGSGSLGLLAAGLLIAAGGVLLAIVALGRGREV